MNASSNYNIHKHKRYTERVYQGYDINKCSIRDITNISYDLPAKLKKKRFQLEQKAYQMRKNDNKSTRIKVIGVKVLLECREKGSLSAWKVVED